MNATVTTMARTEDPEALIGDMGKRARTAAKKLATMSSAEVRIDPGAMALTRMRGARSSADNRV